MITATYTPQALLRLAIGFISGFEVFSESELDRAADVYSMRTQASRVALSGEELCFIHLDELRVALATTTGPVIFAATELGSISLSIAALRSCGKKVATPFWAIARSYVDFADRFEAALIDLNEMHNPHALCHAFELYRRHGVSPFLVVEAPTRSPRRFSFLGGKVRCSRFLSWMARETGSCVILLWNKHRENGKIEIGFKQIAPMESGTQHLLSLVEEEILKEPAQYAWENSAMLYSKNNVPRKIYEEIEVIIEWRQKWLARRSVTAI